MSKRGRGDLAAKWQQHDDAADASDADGKEPAGKEKLNVQDRKGLSMG